MRPEDVMKGQFDWSGYLQRHLMNPGVVVSKLHPIVGLRMAALFVDLTLAGYASDTPGQGAVQISSGVRTREHQTRLYEDICLRRKRCEMVANPGRVHGRDAEGVMRSGSNHQAQKQLPPWGAEVGYAVDLAARDFKPVHERLARYGLAWPLNGKRGTPFEPWHLEAFPRRSAGWLDGPVAWPEIPGLHRPLIRGMIGGDVETLQKMLGISADGIFGPATERAVKKWQAKNGHQPTGVYMATDKPRTATLEPSSESIKIALARQHLEAALKALT